ncbi:hypothetical protein E2C01_043223 [Portunus trituberculatus]|uniref:Uncharacterized protein n=1 Tax=Portunus trituberculatus TaxID=210409 RepID=A0A5B7FYZ2_PORTR|nr:hypothetical protein [Portunus trituberculatus]
MEVPAYLLPLVLLALFLAAPSHSVPKSYFYRFGENAGDSPLPDEDEVSSPEIGLRVPVVFFGRIYQSIFLLRDFSLSKVIFLETPLYVHCFVIVKFLNF